MDEHTIAVPGNMVESAGHCELGSKTMRFAGWRVDGVLDLDAIRPLLLRAEEHHKHLVHYVDGEFECPWCQLSEAWQRWAKAGGQE